MELRDFTLVFRVLLLLLRTRERGKRFQISPLRLLRLLLLLHERFKFRNHISSLLRLHLREMRSSEGRERENFPPWDSFCL